ncbi:MAG TPA: helix-turn-helix domain-containing protein [Candidatus Thermoplasmatota archaeon]|jgi:DNA-binding transcriptional ArsR family regulator|nr:helix-turn-helix domain-containing protein [Candidatus Thermoplasmatota archaeon]
MSLRPGHAAGLTITLVALVAAGARAGIDPDPQNPLVWTCETLDGSCATVLGAYEALYEDPGAGPQEAAFALVGTLQGSEAGAWALERGQATAAAMGSAPVGVASDAAAVSAALDAPSLGVAPPSPPIGAAGPTPALDLGALDGAAAGADGAIGTAAQPAPDLPDEDLEALGTQVEQWLLVQLPGLLLQGAEVQSPASPGTTALRPDLGPAGEPFDTSLPSPLERHDVVAPPDDGDRALPAPAASAPRDAAATAGPAPASPLAMALEEARAPAFAALLSGLLLVPPLYHRLQRHRLLDHEGRARLFRIISERPGIHIEELARLTGMSRSTAVYHLRLLERHAHVLAMGARKSVHYYPNNGGQEPRRREQLALLASPRVRSVAHVIAERPGVARNELAPAAGITLSTLSWHLGRLVAAGLVEDRPLDGGQRGLFPAAGLAELLQPWAQAAFAPEAAPVVAAPAV